MRRWIGPLAFGLIVALAVGYAAIAAIPYGMMKIAMDRLGRGGINQMSQIRVVPVPGRYSSLSIFDAATDVAFVRNDVEAGGKPYRIIVAREGQAVPPGAEAVRVGHDRGIALIRLLLKDPAEIGSLDAIRRQSTCRTVTKSK
jgi:hypothetical protein